MTSEFDNTPSELEIPTIEVIQHSNLINFLNNLSNSITNSLAKPGCSKWIFRNGSDVLQAILEVQKYEYKGEMISINWTTDSIKASWMRTGVFTVPDQTNEGE